MRLRIAPSVRLPDFSQTVESPEFDAGAKVVGRAAAARRSKGNVCVSWSQKEPLHLAGPMALHSAVPKALHLAGPKALHSSVPKARPANARIGQEDILASPRKLALP